MSPDADAVPYEAKQTDGSLLEMGSGMAFDNEGVFREPLQSNDRQMQLLRTQEESKQSLHRGFIGNVVDPSDPQPHDPMPPQVSVTLEHIYGASLQVREKHRHSCLKSVEETTDWVTVFLFLVCAR